MNKGLDYNISVSMLIMFSFLKMESLICMYGAPCAEAFDKVSEIWDKIPEKLEPLPEKIDLDYSMMTNMMKIKNSIKCFSL